MKRRIRLYRIREVTSIHYIHINTYKKERNNIAVSRSGAIGSYAANRLHLHEYHLGYYP